MSLGEYKYVLGEVVMIYQYIESDIKIIIAAMTQGDYNQNLRNVRNNIKGLGEAIRELERVDNYGGNPRFNKRQYEVLKNVARDRNYFCHSCTLDFSYIDNYLDSNEFRKSYEKLISAREGLLRIQKAVEDYRIYALRVFRDR